MVYKHWKAVHAEEAMAEGRIRLGSLQHFREIENAPQGIRDERENLTEGIHAPVHNKTVDRDFQARLAELGIKIGEGSTITMAGNRWVTYGPPCFVFCMSLGAEELGYDTISLVKSSKELEAAILEAARLHFPGRAVWTQQGEITYTARRWDALNERRLAPDPFKKEPEFAYQREVRIALFIPGVGNDAVFLTSARIAQCFEPLTERVEPRD